MCSAVRNLTESFSQILKCLYEGDLTMRSKLGVPKLYNVKNVSD